MIIKSWPHLDDFHWINNKGEHLTYEEWVVLEGWCFWSTLTIHGHSSLESRCFVCAACGWGHVLNIKWAAKKSMALIILNYSYKEHLCSFHFGVIRAHTILLFLVRVNKHSQHFHKTILLCSWLMKENYNPLDKHLWLWRDKVHIAIALKMWGEMASSEQLFISTGIRFRNSGYAEQVNSVKKTFEFLI